MTNRFVSFLKKAGQVLAAGTQIASEFLPILGPLAAAVAPKEASQIQAGVTIAESEVTQLSQAVGAAETMGAALAKGGVAITGAQKAQAAATGVLQIFLNSEAMAGKKIADLVAAQKASVTIAGGIADFWNAVDGSSLPNPPSSPAS